MKKRSHIQSNNFATANYTNNEEKIPGTQY